MRSIGPKIITNGLVLCLDAGNKKSYPGSGSNWYDLTVNKNNGTLIGSPVFSAANRGSIVFDGTNDSGYFNAGIVSTSYQTHEVWTNAVASASAADGFAYILHNNSTGTATGSSYLTIGIKPTQQYYAALNGSYSTMSSGVTATSSLIRQIVLSWDGTNQIMYVDGEVKDSQALSVTPQNFDTITSFGDAESATYRMVQGNIYSIKVYNRALSASEILQNYNSQKSRFL